jgi:hypothetical protein
MPALAKFLDHLFVERRMSSGFRLVTNPLSTTTSWSTQFPPAFRTSVLIAGHEVKVRPRTTPASIQTHAAWQIAATGFLMGGCVVVYVKFR